MTNSGPNARVWIGVGLLGFSALLIAWIGSISAAPGSTQAGLLTFDLFWGIIPGLVGGILIASGLARLLTRKRATEAELRADFATPLVDPGLTYMYQRKPPPPT